jgi:hypothetical protein
VSIFTIAKEKRRSKRRRERRREGETRLSQLWLPWLLF